MNEADRTAGMVAMEETLAADATGAARDALLEELTGYADTVKRAKDQGVRPEEYARLDRLGRGIEVAQTVVRRAWRTMHPDASDQQR